MKDPLRVFRQLFNNDKNVGLLRDYLKGKEVDEKFLNKIFEHKDVFKLEDNKLFYADLEILLSKDKEKALKAELKKNPFVNKQTFYKNIISKKYLNITREQAYNIYLGNDINQLARKPLRPTKKPISSNKDGMYSIDLIEFSDNISKFNKRYRYILVVVNVFTRYTMLAGLTSKKPEILYNKFLESIEEHNIPFKSIKIITCDNGTEFSVLKTELSKRGIKIIQSPTYSPQSNATVERRNREIRNRLRAIFNANNNLVWYNVLDSLEDILNNSYIKTLKGSPLELMNNEELQQEQRETNISRRKEFLEKNKIEIGSFVRVDMAAIFSEVRKAIKSGEYKNIQIRFSPIIFQVISKSNPKDRLSRPTYKIKNIVTNKIIKKNFYSNELQVVNSDNDDIDKETQIKLMQRAHRLNGTKPTKNDLEII